MDNTEKNCPFCGNIPCDWKIYYPAVFNQAWDWESRYDEDGYISVSTIALREMNKERRADAYKTCEKLRTNGTTRGCDMNNDFPICVVLGIRDTFPDPYGRYDYSK